MLRSVLRPRYVAAGLLIFLALAAILLWRALRAPETGPLHLTNVAFAELPGWAQSDPRDAVAAFARSCASLTNAAPKTPMGGTGYAGNVDDWLGACRALPKNPPAANQARAFFEQWFVPAAVGAGEVRDGLFTGYYEPMLRGSRTRHGAYQIPVYGLPGDLISVDLGAFRPELRGEHLAGRIDANRLVPYPARAEIEAKGLSQARILFYGEDAIAVFFLHIQGSGRVVFDDGSTARVAYAAQNGQPYTAIGRVLIAQGALTRETVSLQTIAAWLRAHPSDARRIMATNASFVFFKELPVGDPALGAIGAEGVALTPQASLAVDPRIHALGVPFFVATTIPGQSTSFQHLLIAQDIGGAIRGPVRGDIFWGFGAKAEAIAGQMKQPGRLYVLLPKTLAARNP